MSPLKTMYILLIVIYAVFQQNVNSTSISSEKIQMPLENAVLKIDNTGDQYRYSNHVQQKSGWVIGFCPKKNKYGKLIARRCYIHVSDDARRK